MLYAFLFLPAVLAIGYALLRRGPAERHVVVAEAVERPATISGEPDPFEALESLLAELERATLEERDVEELERLAEQLEQTAIELERVT